MTDTDHNHQIPSSTAEPSEKDCAPIPITEDSIRMLQNLPLFGGINSSVIELILELSSLVHKKQGEYFFREGEAGASTFVLHKGTAATIKSSGQTEYFIRQLKQGDCFGEMAVIDLMPRSASVRAEVDACAIEISASVMLEIYKRNLEQFTMIQMNMGREVSRRLRDVSDRLFAYQLNEYSPLDRQG